MCRYIYIKILERKPSLKLCNRKIFVNNNYRCDIALAREQETRSDIHIDHRSALNGKTYAIQIHFFVVGAQRFRHCLLSFCAELSCGSKKACQQLPLPIYSNQYRQGPILMELLYLFFTSFLCFAGILTQRRILDAIYILSFKNTPK